MPHERNDRSAAPAGAPIPRVSFLIFAGIIAAMFAVGSVADYSIAQSLFAPDNPFGVLFAAYGEAPALLAVIAAGTLAITARPPVHTVLRWFLVLGGAGLIVAGTLALIIRPEMYWTLPASVRTFVAVLLAAGTVWATRRVCAGATWQAMCVVAAALFVVVAAEIVLVQGVKILWERPRMRLLADTDVAFAQWWSPGHDAKGALLSGGVEANEFKSFPSGHTANAATAMMLTGFALLRADLRRYAATLFWVGALWALAVAASRMSLGAHFLTDTAAAILLCLGCVLIGLALAAAVLERGLLDRLVRQPQELGPTRHGRDTH